MNYVPATVGGRVSSLDAGVSGVGRTTWPGSPASAQGPTPTAFATLLTLLAGVLALLVGTAPAAGQAVSFQGPTDYAVGDLPLSVAVGDFNADSDPDLAVANRMSDNVSVLLNSVGPTTKITKRPKSKIKVQKKWVRVTVEFTSETGTTFRCRLDKADYERCVSPYEAKARSKRGDGMKHKISIKARDRAGNVGKTATVAFKVIRKG